MKNIKSLKVFMFSGSLDLTKVLVKKGLKQSNSQANHDYSRS